MSGAKLTERTVKSNIKKIEVTGCNCCGSQRFRLVTTGAEHEYDNTTDDQFTVMQCLDCGLGFLNPRPDVCELPTIYPPNYYSYNQQKLRAEANPRSILNRVRYRGFLAKIGKALSLCAKSEPVTVLDIGCGDGHLLDLFREAAGEAVETHGVDFNHEAIRQAAGRGHKTYAGRFEDVELPSGYFDLVVASHVIEHVEDPRAFTQKAFRILKRGGIFWFETPNFNSLDARLFRRRHWGAYHFPRHWYFFDPQSVSNLARLTGFKVVMIDFYWNAIFWFWTAHSIILSMSPRLRPLADALFPPVDFQRDTLGNFLRICFFCGLDVLIKLCTGQTSNMVVAFKKPLSRSEDP